MSIKIAIVDDHPTVISGVRQMLADQTDMKIVASYESSRALLDELINPTPDIMFLDIHMPGSTGEELMPILKERYPSMRIIVLTGFHHVFYVRSMLQLGAQGYVLKTSDKPVMLDAIRSVYENKAYIDPELRLTLDKVERFEAGEQIVVLSKRERQVLTLWAQGYSSQEMSEKLLLGLQTIKNYRFSILTKMDVHNGAALIKKAVELRLV